MILGISWLVAEAACLAGLARWHQFAPSRHLVLMISGLGFVTILGLPELFADFFGYEALSDYADRLFKPSYLDDQVTWGNSGARLVGYCQLFVWIGLAVFALGWWRQVHEPQDAPDDSIPL